MKISILTYGSRGDVQPFLALAVALQKAGHAPTLAAPGRFVDLATGYGIPFAPLAGDPAEISRRINNAGQNPFRMVRAIQGYVFGIAAHVAQQALAVCQGSDLIIHSFLFTTGGHVFARHLGIPDISAQTFPIFAPTRAFPNVAFPAIPPGWMSYFTHWLATQIFWYGGNSGYGRVRKAMPGTFPRKPTWPFRQTPERPRTPMLCAWSPTVIPVQPEWNDDVRVTGYWTLNDESGYQPPAALMEFLSAGEPPVCVSFGSMVNRNADQIYQAVFNALATTHNRAVILSGWSELQSGKNPDELFILDAAPHHWLFPRCKAVIHHGGAGTTAAGLCAGIPNIVVPFAADQPFWGRRVALLGAGPAPIPVKKLTAESLIWALVEAESSDIRGRAQSVGCALRVEDGLGTAVKLIEQYAVRFSEGNFNFQP
jgi:sterol 3beta-glucosyltransferase